MSPRLSPEPCWMWTPDPSAAEETNTRFRFERSCQVAGFSGSEEGRRTVEISADSRYRLWINGRHVADGPARGYPALPFMDQIEVSAFLRQDGRPDEFTVEVSRLGVDTFQYIRGEPGLWLRMVDENGAVLLVSDTTWLVRRVAGHTVNTPRISPQLGFEEHFDGSRPEATAKTAIVAPSRIGQPRPCEGTSLRNTRIHGRHLIRRDRVRPHPRGQAWTIHARAHLGPFPRGINLHGMAGVFAAEFHADRVCTLEFSVIGLVRELCVDGAPLPVTETEQDLRRHRITLASGAHGISLSVCDRYDHVPELSIAWKIIPEKHDADAANDAPEIRWGAPSAAMASAENEDQGASPWVSTGPLWSCEKDTHCPIRADGSIDPGVDTFGQARPTLTPKVDALACHLSQAGFLKIPELENLAPLPRAHLAEADAYFVQRLDHVQTDTEFVDACTPMSLGTPIRLQRDSRMLVDFGDITNGFFEMEIETVSGDVGAVIDAYCFEHYDFGSEPPRIQYLQNDGNPYRTSFRYIAREGRQTFLSAQRRGFRYVMLTVRNVAGSVTFHKIATVESLHPVDPARTATFSSSDQRLDAIFRMSQRTLHLCMEDTFTDCPSYEQALWVGDARHESLFAAVTFGAYDLATHSARIIAESHEHMRMPLAACQCPSGWDAVLPAFSFLWVISVEEIWWHTGDNAFRRDMLPAVRRTLDTALRLCTHEGLFSAPTWNFLDWTPIDQGHETVLHNSILLAGALGAYVRMTNHPGEPTAGTDARHYADARERLVTAIGRLWRTEANAFADALPRLPQDNGTIRTSQHTSFLALLFETLPSRDLREAALRNCIVPPSEMTRVGSPFAMYFLLETLLREGHSDRVLAQIRTFWGRMLDAGSTTCWEMVNTADAAFPTRSYCHGWSAGPVYLLPFLFFGIEILEPGWKRIRLKPNLHGLDHVEATVNTPCGLLRLRLRKSATGDVEFAYAAPVGVEVLHAHPELAPQASAHLVSIP